MSKEIFDLYCPVCGKKMIDILFVDEKGFEFPEKQCPECLTIYQLGSEAKIGAHAPNQIILAPRNKKWLKKYGKKYLRNFLPNSW